MGSVSDKKELWTCERERVHVLAGPLSPKEMGRFLQFRQQHYVLYAEREKHDYSLHASASGVYFLWCCANNEPFIDVTNSRIYCTVGMDLITLEGSHKFTMNAQGRQKVYELIKKVVAPTAVHSGGPIVTFAFAHGIYKEKGPEVAAELYRIWQECKIKVP